MGNGFLGKSAEELEDMREESREALRERTEKRKEKILEFMKMDAGYEKRLAGCELECEDRGVTCNDIEEFLDVSEKTARKYLNELEDEGKIEQVGVSGRGVYYVLK
ncbi:FaeA/PapI family transcriptional regulator [Patescibacteria group bacterium]